MKNAPESATVPTTDHAAEQLDQMRPTRITEKVRPLNLGVLAGPPPAGNPFDRPLTTRIAGAPLNADTIRRSPAASSNELHTDIVAAESPAGDFPQVWVDRSAPHRVIRFDDPKTTGWFLNRSGEPVSRSAVYALDDVRLEGWERVRPDHPILANVETATLAPPRQPLNLMTALSQISMLFGDCYASDTPNARTSLQAASMIATELLQQMAPPRVAGMKLSVDEKIEAGIPVNLPRAQREDLPDAAAVSREAGAPIDPHKGLILTMKEGYRTELRTVDGALLGVVELAEFKSAAAARVRFEFPTNVQIIGQHRRKESDGGPPVETEPDRFDPE